jgi:hypothetical protein
MRLFRPIALQHFAAALVVSASFLSGCVTPTRVALPDAHRAQIHSTQTIAALDQREIGIHVIRSTGGAAFGLIGAIIDSAATSSRTSAAEEAVAPLRDVLVDYDAGRTLDGALRRELGNVPWLSNGGFEARLLQDPKDPDRWLEQSPADALLVIVATYKLTPAGDALFVEAAVTLRSRTVGVPKVPKKPQSDFAVEEPPKPLFHNGFRVIHRLPGFPTGEVAVADAVKLWAVDGGRPARAAIDSAFSELARMVAFDLQQGAPPNEAAYKAPHGAREMTPKGIPGEIPFPGFVVREEGGRSWVRFARGTLWSVP